MELLKFLLLGLILSDADGRFTIKSHNGSNTAQVEIKAKLRLVADIIAARPGDNIVVVADVDVIEEFSGVDVGMRYVTLIQAEKLSSRIVQKIAKVHLKDNKPSCYLILPSQMYPDSKIKGMISTVQSTDSYAKVAVIYPTFVNVKDLYEDKKIYNVQIFIPGPSSSVHVGNNESDKIRYKMFRVCKVCSNGDDIIEAVNDWSFKFGFIQILQFKKSFQGNFHKTQVRNKIIYYV